MERNIFLTVLIGSLLAVVVAMMIPGRVADKDPKLPWKIEVDENGSSTVFGLKLGHSTLEDAQQILSDIGEVDLLIAKDGEKTVEAYFQTIFLSGLKADFVLTLGVDDAAIEQMYQRGLQLSTLESGIKKADLSPEDLAVAAGAPVIHITYLPKTDLDEELIQNHFGVPEQIIKEPETGISHWLYPKKGLDIAVDPERKEVFQYISPAEFRTISAPLEELAKGAEELPSP